MRGRGRQRLDDAGADPGGPLLLPARRSLDPLAKPPGSEVVDRQQASLLALELRGPGGERQPAGTFRYRWGDDSDATLSAALDLSRTRALGVRVGSRTFFAAVGVT